MRIDLDTGTPCELAVPDGPPVRGLVIIPDIFGLRPLFDDHVARLAAEHDWAVAAIEPWPGREGLDIDARLASVGTLDADVLLGDAIAAADQLGCEPVAILGFCMGGMFALDASATGRFDRAVSCYGMIRVPERWQSPTIPAPLDAVADPLAAPVLAIIGTEDHWTPAADVADLEAAGATVVRYEGADHGFVHDPSRPAHRADDAADVWRRIVAFLAVDDA